MIELNLKDDDIYLINVSKVNCINGYLDDNDVWTICINFGYDNDIYIYCSNENDFRYAMNKLMK